jgi:hypothetical protein
MRVFLMFALVVIGCSAISVKDRIRGLVRAKQVATVTDLGTIYHSGKHWLRVDTEKPSAAGLKTALRACLGPAGRGVVGEDTKLPAVFLHSGSAAESYQCRGAMNDWDVWMPGLKALKATALTKCEHAVTGECVHTTKLGCDKCGAGATKCHWTDTAAGKGMCLKHAYKALYHSFPTVDTHTYKIRGKTDKEGDEYDDQIYCPPAVGRGAEVDVFDGITGPFNDGTYGGNGANFVTQTVTHHKEITGDEKTYGPVSTMTCKTLIKLKLALVNGGRKQKDLNGVKYNQYKGTDFPDLKCLCAGLKSDAERTEVGCSGIMKREYVQLTGAGKEVDEKEKSKATVTEMIKRATNTKVANCEKPEGVTKAL